MEIIVVRHGLSEANKNGVISGRLDSPLTKEGKQQAQDLARRLKGLGIERVFSSPLQRTIKTAEPISEELGIPITNDQRLIEVDFGNFEGKSSDEMVKALKMEPREFLNTYEYDFRSHGGESSKEVEARVRSFLEDLKKHNYKLVLIVTHGGIVRWINYVCTGEKMGPSPNAEELTLKT